jgi:hypothetical protein
MNVHSSKQPNPAPRPPLYPTDDLITRSRMRVAPTYAYNLGTQIIYSPTPIPTLEWAAEHLNNTNDVEHVYDPHAGSKLGSSVMGPASVTGKRQRLVNPTF